MAKTPKPSAIAQEKIDEARKPAVAPQAAEAEMAGPKGAIILVRGPEAGRRRGGLTFGPVDAEVDLSTITREQALAIMNDPCLNVRPKPEPEGSGDDATGD